MTYRVRATPDAALDKIAPAVDKVLVEQMQRLADHVDASVKDAPALGLEERFFDSAGVRLRYLEVGKGDPVILLHDIGGDSDAQWRDTGVMRLVADNARAIALDARGHGKSARPADPARYGAEMAEDVVRLMDHLGIAKAHVVGYGMGAQVAAKLAATHPQRLQTLVLAGATSLRRWTPQDEQRAGDDPVRRSLGELVVPDERMAALPVPTLGVVAMQDASMRDFVELKPLMPRLVRMVAIEGATHETTTASSDFGVALMYFLRYHPMAK
jgi:pimeloyl-ACP methyl ester carboxylesterase